jgi:hypothetical protein
MTNREKYAEQILDIALAGGSVAVDKKGNICRCTDVGCNNCIFAKTKTDDKRSCEKRIKEWSEQEYVEPSVDWSKVPVDTKVFIRDSDSQPWRPRYFAKFENGKIYTWNDGRSSFTSLEPGATSWWNQGKLAEDTV